MNSKIRTTRLMTEVQDSKSPPDGVQYGPVGDDLTKWQAIIQGPDGSAFAGTKIELDITIPETYPKQPPQIKVTSPWFQHPNVYKGGAICMSILKTETDRTEKAEKGELWSMSKTICSCLLSFLLLLAEPNLSSPANIDANRSMMKNREVFAQLTFGRYLRYDQDQKGAICLEEDQAKEELKRKRNEEEQNSSSSGQSKIIKKEASTPTKQIVLPEEPAIGGILMKFRTTSGELMRRFSEHDGFITMFNFLHNQKVKATKIVFSRHIAVTREEAVAEEALHKKLMDHEVTGSYAVDVFDEEKDDDEDD